jgi:hypothetical protein
MGYLIACPLTRGLESGAWGRQAGPRPAMIQNDAQTWEDLYETETETSQNPLKRVRVCTIAQPLCD